MPDCMLLRIFLHFLKTCRNFPLLTILYYQMKTKRLFLFLPVFISFLSNGQIVTFYRENMTFLLDSAHMEVKGDIYFQNSSSEAVEKTFFFPVSCHGQSIKVDSISVFDCSKNSYIKPARKNIAGILFSMNFSPKEEKKLKIRYVQDHDGRTTGYILTKIKYWITPLTQGNYKLIVNDPRITIDSTTFKPNNSTIIDGKATLTWNKSNFMPDKELCFYFH